ncbi:helix-turn-helix domain-containing protein [Streptomyces sp. NPDC059787]|uniref:helix-turn-helix domain-containing protein n=1 Tax=Streptomyces sp. NPDC059787 TaxID=3346947 RepID=UPI0036673EDA
MKEVLTGYRSGSPELAADGEPRGEYAPAAPMEAKKTAKAAELGVTVRTIERWLAAFRDRGEAGLAPRKGHANGPAASVDQRWVETALEVMVEHTDASRPSRTMVIERTRARVIARFGPEAVPQPSRATAFRILEDLERQHPLFRLSTKRNRDIADRPEGLYGKLRPTRPGEYLLMDSTRLDVFAFDPLTLRWVQAELSIGMDWYTRCITGVRVTPVSTKAVDVAAVLFESFRPRPVQRGLAARGRLARAWHPAHRAGRRCRRGGWAWPCRRSSRRRWWSTTARSTSRTTSPVSADAWGSRCSPLGCGQVGTKARLSGSSEPCVRTCCRPCPATRAQTSTPVGRIRRRRRSSSSTNWRRSSGSGLRRSLTVGRTPVWSTRGCGCPRRRCSSTAWPDPDTSRSPGP